MVSLGPEVIGSFFGVKVTNTILATIIVDSFFLLLIISIHKNIQKIPGALQSIFEMIIDYFYSLAEQMSGKNAKTIFPWTMSFFLVILFTNLIGLLPGFGTIGLFEHKDGHEKFIPLLRAATSDFNATLALATTSLVATHIVAIKLTGIRDYLAHFFSLNPILLFVGMLELVSEFIKLFSLSFRLFGNIFAGEVVLHTIGALFAFVAPIPFLLLEMIVALVQALVFSLLTMVFMSILATKHSEGGEH
jgi:F-type H+-transporting ATPase subunit a